jgi:hypothetical protein
MELSSPVCQPLRAKRSSGSGSDWQSAPFMMLGGVPDLVKCRGRKLRLVMLGGGCNDVGDHHLPGALERRAEQLMA